MCYLDFLSEYFYLLGFTKEEERLAQIHSTLLDCWRYAPYIRRVSDLERFLEIQLEKRSSGHAAVFDSPHARIGELNHVQRFLLVARTYQSWTYKSLQLATRIKKHEIPSALTQLKCTLTGIDSFALKTSQQIFLFRVNDLLEGELKTSESRIIEKEIHEHSLILQFKADWLAYRCELAELKQQMDFEPSVVNGFKKRLIEDFQTVPNNQPRFRDYLINHFSFKRIPTP